MCGFNGVITKNKIENIDYLINAKKFIDRRGPDAFGFTNFFLNDNYFHLQHARLSIIDLNTASNQPFEKEGYTLVYNGEIYNYNDIKYELKQFNVEFITESDTEVIIEAFKKWGISCVNKFIGMFSFALLDKKDNQLYLCRDRAGVKPLYYTVSKKEIIFSSDLYALKYLSNDNLTLNISSISNYFRFGYTTGYSTYLNNVEKVKPGTYIVFNLKNFNFDEKFFWKPIQYFDQIVERDEKDLILELEEILESSVGYRMVSDVPVGIFLSGGYDSSLVAAILKKKLNYDICCFTIGFEDEKYDESKYAIDVSNHLGVKHHVNICTVDDVKNLLVDLVEAYDEPFGDSSAIPTMLVSSYASKHVKVVLSADGGDEIFGGYSKYINTFKYYNRLHNTPIFLRQFANIFPESFIKFMINSFTNNKINLHHALKLKNIIKSDSLLEMMIKLGENPNVNLLNYDYDNLTGISIGDLNSMLLYDYQNYLESDILKKIDRATMFYSIEGREPLLDHRLFEFMARIPESYKIKNNISKYIFKKVVHKYLPESIMSRPKMGFGIPINKMIHSDHILKEYFFDIISDNEIKKCEFLNYDEFTSLKNMYLKNHDNGFISLWYLFNFLRWKTKINC
jgi:asparagine synthase (glutamine-hydrolysing)